MADPGLKSFDELEISRLISVIELTNAGKNDRAQSSL